MSSVIVVVDYAQLEALTIRAIKTGADCVCLMVSDQHNAMTTATLDGLYQVVEPAYCNDGPEIRKLKAQLSRAKLARNKHLTRNIELQIQKLIGYF